MAQTKQQIQALLDAAELSPKHRFGQNFMIDGNLLRLVARAGELTADDLAIEVGPGTGSLTEEILAAGCQVVAVEIDHDLARLLRERMGNLSHFKLIEADALAGKHAIHSELLAEIAAAKHAGRTVKLVANLPYNSACPLVIELLIAGVELLAFTVQREVADRLRAGAGSDMYGPLSVMAQLLARVEVLRTLPPQAFWPAPKVESALVRMRREDRLGKRAQDVSRFVHEVFSYRRKMLRKAMVESGVAEKKAEAAMAAVGVEPTIRPERLTPEQWLKLFEAVTSA
jgi:16S rRNA (adenine1518-N6/adenine1519-N6)-dimethyltransferase